ncbi:MAG: aminopeptidase P family N-terminal domain-containing protein, partial [Pseudomonadota bacterium]
MFQSFEDVTDPTLAAPRVTALRARLNDMGLDGFIVPHADEHQSEYLPVHAERLFWLTGFSGSAGSAVIMADRAAIFVDGRYTLQVRDQVDGDIFAYRHLMEEPPTAWLKNNVAGGQSIGLDPWLHTERQVKDLRAAVEAAGGTLVFVDANPLDAVWDNRPPPPQAPVSLHPSALAGKAADKKIADIKASLVEERVDAAVLTACDSVAWLFNIRGWDVSHKPLALANAVIPTEGKPTIFMDRAKLSNAVADALSELA